MSVVKGRRLSRSAVLAALVLVAAVCASASLGAAPPWAGASYRGHGTGVWPKNTVMLTVSASGTSIPIYAFSIDTFCGKAHVGGRETYIWPFSSQGSPAFTLSASGAFRTSQHGSFMVPPIPTVTTAREPGSYRFLVSGTVHAAGATVSGHLTLEVETHDGSFCVDTNSPFSAKRVG